MQLLKYRPNVCMFVLNRNNLVFLGERLGFPNHWQLPQGGVEPKQSEEDNVLRELEEELGVKREMLEIKRKLSVVNQYDFKKPPDYAKGRYRGQRQSFWVVKFLGDDSAVKLDAHDREFSAFKWIRLDELLSAVDPIRKSGYTPAVKELLAFLEEEKKAAQS